MRVERIYAEGTALLNSSSAEKRIREEKHILDTDAVTFDHDRQKDHKEQAKEEKPEEESKKDETPTYSAKPKTYAPIPAGKCLDILA